LEISGAKDLIQYFQEIGPHPSHERLLRKRRTIRSAGLLVHQFHEAGFFHGDLQLKNILVSGEQLFLIDFDHSYQKEVLTADEKKKNLLRLNRSGSALDCRLRGRIAFGSSGPMLRRMKR
jgi:tRNA A-37 threonylcarbamoyl transferase component Bud32